VVTHEDITEREHLNAQLARQNELLRQREEELNHQTPASSRHHNMLQACACSMPSSAWCCQRHVTRSFTASPECEARHPAEDDLLGAGPPRRLRQCRVGEGGERRHRHSTSNLGIIA